MARVTLNNETYNAATNGSEISGNTGTEQVNVFAGVTGLQVAGNIERVDLPGNIADFTFSSFGNSLTVRDGSGNIVASISDAGGKDVVFEDGKLDVAFDSTTSTLTVGGVTVTGTAAAITPAASAIDTSITSDSPDAGTGGGGTGGGGTGSTFTLTTALDVLNGTAAGDSFVGDNGTASLGDQVNGQAGDDTLTLFGTANLPQLSSVENVIFDTVNAAVTTANRAGIEDVTIQNSIFTADRAVTLANGETLTLVNHEGAVDIDLSTTKGSETVTLNDVGNATGADVDLDLTASGTDVTELTLNGTGASSDVDLEDTDNKLATLKITGDQNIDVENAAITSLKTYDASAAGTGQSITIGATVDATITGSTGDDTFNLGGTLTTMDTIDGGTGTDTLQVALQGGNVAGDLAVTNVEVLRLDDVTADRSIDMDNVAGITTLRVSEGTASDTLTVTDIVSTATTVQFIGDGTDAAQSFDGIVVDYDVTTAIAATEVVVNNGGLEAKGVTIGGIQADLTKAVTINATEVGTAAGEVLTTGIITGSSLESVTINSNSDVNTTITGTGELKTVDLSGADAGITLDLNAVEADATTTLGDGGDSIDVQGTLLVANTVDLGSGTDTITFVGDATNGNVEIKGFTAGTGGDVIDFNANGAVITDGAGSEVTLGTEGGAAAADLELDGFGLSIIAGGSTTQYNGAFTTADLAAYFLDYNGANNDVVLDAETDDVYLALDNGADTAILRITGADTLADNVTIEAAEITIVGVLDGVGDATSLTAANFADFL